MKRFVAVLCGILVLPAFAEVAPIYYDEIIEYTDEDVGADDEALSTETASVVIPLAQPAAATPRTANRNISRAVPATTRANSSTRSGSGRVVASRTTSNAVTSRTAKNVATRGTTSRVATRASRAATNGTQQIATTRRAMQSGGANSARASILQTDTVNTPLYTGRVSTRSGAVRARIPTIASISSQTTDTTSTADATASMDELAQVTDFCKAQYTSCMDNFCNVLDDNQGRCSCSRNLKNYEETERALKAATEALQDVAQQIQYIGLSADQIESLFTQTEAELKMQSTQDNTQLKNDLDRIRDLIVDVKTGTASSTVASNGLNFDINGLLDFSIDSTGFDLNALFGGTSSNTSSISNQRGEELYKTAAARCKASVLNNCASQGVDISVITNSYDLEIDKQCIAYERSLTDTNEEMAQTVRNAKAVLQRARLITAQQKNNLSRLQCIQELDKCMRDEYVCGTKYEYCLDPTGKYIVNGAIVVGSTPGEAGMVIDGSVDNGLYSMWNYSDGNNAWSAGGTLPQFIESTIATNIGDIDGSTDNISKYLQSKIGYYNKSENKNYGNCMSVLNQCQDYTYSGTNNSDREYIVNNTVINDYLQRTLINVKATQDTILSDYAEQCVKDVSSCLTANNYDPDANRGTTMSTKNKIATKACNSQIITCMSVNGISDQDVGLDVKRNEWILAMMGADIIQEDDTPGSGNIPDPTPDSGNENPTPTPDPKQAACEGSDGIWNNGTCNCNDTNKAPDANGTCVYSETYLANFEAACGDKGLYSVTQDTGAPICVFVGKDNNGLTKEVCQQATGTWNTRVATCIFRDYESLQAFELPSAEYCTGDDSVWSCDLQDCKCICNGTNKVPDANGTCECADGYVGVSGACVNETGYNNCISGSGTWSVSGNTCDCPENKKWDTASMACQTAEWWCGEAEGTWESGACKCSSGAWNEGEYKCE